MRKFAGFLALLLGAYLIAGSDTGGLRAQTGDEVAVATPQAPSREYLIKAALLYKFAKFTKWPNNTFADSSTPLRVCILGEDPFGPALRTIEGKRIRERPLLVRRLSALPEAERCHLMFVSQSEEESLDGILAYLGDQPVLTVADMPDFTNQGGVINLRVVDDRNRFEVNMEAANRAGLILSSKMLRLADEVHSN